jgi:hypothetical protein
MYIQTPRDDGEKNDRESVSEGSSEESGSRQAWPSLPNVLQAPFDTIEHDERTNAESSV